VIIGMDDDDLASYGAKVLQSDAGFTTGDERSMTVLPALVKRVHMEQPRNTGFDDDDTDEDEKQRMMTRPVTSMDNKRIPRQHDNTDEEETNDTEPGIPDDEPKAGKQHAYPKPKDPASSRAPLWNPRDDPILSRHKMSDPAHGKDVAKQFVEEAAVLPKPPTVQISTPHAAMAEFDASWTFLVETIALSNAIVRASGSVDHLNIFKDNYHDMYDNLEGKNEWEKVVKYMLMMMRTTQRVILKNKPAPDKIDKEVKALLPDMLPVQQAKQDPRKKQKQVLRKVREASSVVNIKDPPVGPLVPTNNNDIHSSEPPPLPSLAHQPASTPGVSKSKKMIEKSDLPMSGSCDYMTDSESARLARENSGWGGILSFFR
jgi:hypothetical protein